MKGVSIIVTAWHTEKYIEECLESIQNQTYFKNHKGYEILIGVDGCENTLNKLKDIVDKYKNLTVYYFEENVGTYIVTNTLCNIAKYDYLIRFDSDDIMKEDMVEKMIKHITEKNCDYVIPKTTELKSKNRVKMAQGHILLKKSVFTKFGGFRPFICGADSELQTRLRPYIKISILPDSVSYFRTHNESLTTKNDTGAKSEYRRKVADFIAWETHYLKSEGDAIIQCITANPKKLLEDGVLSDTIGITVEEHINDNDLYERWKKSGRVNDVHINCYKKYPTVKASPGYSVFY